MNAVTERFRLKSGVAACAAALLAAGTAGASPFQTESTSIATSVELKSSMEYRDTTGKQTFISPKLAAAFPLAPNLEGEIGAQHRKVTRDSGSRSGLGDTTLELKWRFREESARGPAMAIVPEFSIPTGSERRGLGDGHAALAIPFAISKHIQAKHVGAVKLGAELGYVRSFGGDSESFPVGVLATFHPTEALEIGAELAGEADRHDMEGVPLSSNIGFKWQARKQLEIHGLIGRTVRSAGEDPMTRAKLVAEYHMR